MASMNMKSNEGAIEALARKRESLRQERERTVAIQLARAQAEERVRKEAIAELRSRCTEMMNLKARVDETNAHLIADLDRMINSANEFRQNPSPAQINLQQLQRNFLQQTELTRRQARQEALEREQDRINHAQSQVCHMPPTKESHSLTRSVFRPGSFVVRLYRLAIHRISHRNKLTPSASHLKMPYPHYTIRILQPRCCS
jgi:hypothetical protein